MTHELEDKQKGELMFELNEFSKIFIVTPSTYFNGGGELLHQLCDVLRRNSRKAYMCYYDNNTYSYVNVQLPENLKEYNLESSLNIEDSADNVLIVPETITQPLKMFHHIQKCIWWLGMSNYFWRSELNKHNATLIVCYHWIKYLIGLNTPLPLCQLKKMNIQHLSQCWYGVAVLQSKGVHNVAYLSDYINTLHGKSRKKNVHRKDIVLYNAKRNTKYIEKLKKRDKSISYVPIQNMTAQQVAELLESAKVYIDFGHHPGKDRLPREAVMHGCCILTSTIGSADFWDDVPIDSEFKFDRTINNIQNIINKMHDILENYSAYTQKFDGYREYIKEEKDKFEKDVLKFFQ